jgi:hypothetical protein
VLDRLSYVENATRKIAVREGLLSDFKCPTCGRLVEYYRTNCESGHFVGFPNVRRAQEMRAELLRHYGAALDDAQRRGVTARVQQLETILQGSIATINIDAKLFSNMAKSQNYMSYYNAACGVLPNANIMRIGRPWTQKFIRDASQRLLMRHSVPMAAA